MSFQTPILFLVFNRPDTTQRVFEKIKEQRPSKLYIAADGARQENENDQVKCAQVLEIVSKIDWECEAKTLFRQKNLGCKQAVSEAISWFFENEEMGIILEDDCLPNNSFFPFCEELLHYYKDDERIMHIGGNNFQFGKRWTDATYYFSKYNHIWGWASWRRAWKFYTLDSGLYEDFKKSNQINYLFNLKSEHWFWFDHFDSIYYQKVNTWDAQWTLSMWMQNGLCILPNINLVTNIGFSDDALHTKDPSNIMSGIKTEELDRKIIHPKYVVTNFEADIYAFNKIFKPSLVARTVLTLLKFFKIN